MSELEAFYDTYIDTVYKYFYINCLNRHVAEDLTSATFVAFVDKTQSTQMQDWKRYLYGVMRNIWADHLREKYRQVVESLEAIEDFEQHVDQSVTNFETSDLKARARQFIERLPQKQREIATMRFLQGCNIKEIAAQLDTSVSHVKTTQNRAIKSLKKMLAEPHITGGQVS